MTAPIIEIFSSIQGEGLLLGERQIFLRFAGCNLCCAYCDTPDAQKIPPTCRIETVGLAFPCQPGGGRRNACPTDEISRFHRLSYPLFVGQACPEPSRRKLSLRKADESPASTLELFNPLTVEQVTNAIRSLDSTGVGGTGVSPVGYYPRLHHSVSLTGGEPLLHADFLLELLPRLGDLGLGAYLETNGTLPEELAKVIGRLDVVCADIKLPSATKQAPEWDRHEQFLLVLAAHEDPARHTNGGQARPDFVKCIITADCDPEEIERAARLIASISPEMTLILQPATRPAGKPATPSNTSVTPPLPYQMLSLQAIAKHHLPHVRIIPQMHKLGGYI